MILVGKGEFRRLDEKVSGKGNKYYNVVFEDCDSGDQVKSYVKIENNFSVPVGDLVRGNTYTLVFNRYYDYGKQNFDLVDIKSIDDFGKDKK